MTNIMLPYGAGSATPEPEKDDAHEPGSDVGTEGLGSGDSEDLTDSGDYRKQLTTLQPRLARRGIELHELKAGKLLAVGTGLTVHFYDLTAAQDWTREVQR